MINSREMWTADMCSGDAAKEDTWEVGILGCWSRICTMAEVGWDGLAYSSTNTPSGSSGVFGFMASFLKLDG